MPSVSAQMGISIRGGQGPAWPALNAPVRGQVLLLLGLLILAAASLFTAMAAGPKTFRAGAYAMDVTPTNFPVHVLGMFTDRISDTVADPLFARCLVLDDGEERLALVVVDSCMMPRDLLDEAKARAQRLTGLRPDHILISATHTHSAPAVMGGLGTPADTNYARFLPPLIAEGIERAVQNLAPARIGWTVTQAPEHTHTRRWIYWSDKMPTDPFGERTVRANMHPGYQNPAVIGPSGPSDPDLSILSIQSPQGRPVALLANYSMHYYDSPMISADYFGKFARKIARLLGAPQEEAVARLPGVNAAAAGQATSGPAGAPPSFLGIMSQGTSGDQMWMDYGQPQNPPGLEAYSEAIAQKVFAACQSIQYRDWVPLATREAKLTLNFRWCDDQRLAWAQELVATMRGRLPCTLPEVYACEQVYLRQRPTAELKLQAVRIGDLGITALPNEVYAITGLKLKAQSPLQPTFNIGLANGAEGYIPPPEQHQLGGYTTWAARTAGLEVEAEPKIVATLLRLLEEVAGRPRRKLVDTHGAYAQAVLAARPAHYWRLNDFNGPSPVDATGPKRQGAFTGGVAFYLSGPDSPAFSGPSTMNRAPHFAGGYLRVAESRLPQTYAVELWFWNGLPPTTRGITALLFSRESAGGLERLGIGGTNGVPGRLFLILQPTNAPSMSLTGRTDLARKAWHHVVLVRDADRVAVYLDGGAEPELAGPLPTARGGAPGSLFFGGTPDAEADFEGKLDEIAYYRRALRAEEVAAHYRASGMSSAAAAAGSAGPDPHGPYARAVLDAGPLAYWRLDESGDGLVRARDATARENHGVYAEDGIRWFQEGPTSAAFSGAGAVNHAPRFAGGRMRAELPGLGETYSVEFWFCNELPNDARPVTGYLFSRGLDGAEGAPGDHLGIGGTHLEAAKGRLMFFNGNQLNTVLAGSTVIQPGSWNHVVLVRAGRQVTVYLNGRGQPELAGTAAVGHPPGVEQTFLGGRSDNFANFQGTLDEVSVYGRALTAAEAAAHFQAAGVAAGTVVPAPRYQMEAAPLSPAQSMRAMRLRPGFAIELVAAEPLVQSPVAIDWGADGRLWVVEMADYPMGLDGKMKAGGRVRFLRDSDGDGKYDQSTVFLEGLNFPNGIITWREGVIVTAAPEVFYAEDTDGDGRADARQTLFKGFVEGNPQLRVNGLRWGLDGWLYCANGWSGGRVEPVGGLRRPPLQNQAVDISGRDLRLDPDSGRIEPQAGQSEFGRERTDWDDWFGCDNSYPLFHFPLPDQYVRRNPHVPAPEPKDQLLLPANPKVYPCSRSQKRYHTFEHADRFTAACSTMIYRDTLLFGSGAVQHVFTCEPVHHIVHHEILSEIGSGFAAQRPAEEQQSEFLASADMWFRPVMVRTGPDGALWLVDMYRYMIEHPEWLPPDGQEELKPFYRAGENHGRIYRIHPASGRSGGRQRRALRLDKRSVPELVAALETSNGWQRDKVQQMLTWKKEPAAVAHLERLTVASTHPLARLQALCTLATMGALRPALITRALRDPHPGVRRHAIRLAEPLAEQAEGLLAAVVALVDDPDSKVRLQLALSLGQWRDPRAGRALARLAVANWTDRHITAAVLSSALHHAETIVNGVVTAGGPVAAGLRESLFGLVLALEQRDPLARLLEPILQVESGLAQTDRMQALASFLDLLTRRRTSLEKLAGQAADGLAERLARAPALFSAARRVAADAGQPPPARAAALSLVGREAARRAADLEFLTGFLGPQTPAELQLAAIRALGKTADAAVPTLLARQWGGLGPASAAAAVDELLGREPWALALLESLAGEGLAGLNLDVTRRERLLKHPSERVRSLAARVLKAVPNPDRQQVIEAYRPALQLQGDPQGGVAVFTRLCSTCHKVDEVGRDLGPNLRSIANQSRERLLTSILDPSREVAPQFVAYTATLTDDEELYGLIDSETTHSLTLRLLNGAPRTILRSEIASLRSGKVSLMPEGLEAGLTTQDLADLIAFLLPQSDRPAARATAAKPPF